jgi:hypothetical protein
VAERAMVARPQKANSYHLAEIAHITLQETDLELAGIVDGNQAGQKFFGRDIQPLSAIEHVQYDSIVIAAYPKKRCCCKGPDSSRSIEEIFARNILI